MKKDLLIKRTKEHIDRLVSRPFTVRASRLVDRLMLQARRLEGKNE